MIENTLTATDDNDDSLVVTYEEGLEYIKFDTAIELHNANAAHLGLDDLIALQGFIHQRLPAIRKAMGLDA